MVKVSVIIPIFNMEKYLAEHFDDPIFAETSLRCVGCGACTYTCPTCHCFDIVDEGGAAKGQRRLTALGL